MYALVDCNSFYCSCERIFRPDLNNKPVIVLSNNDGCAIARSQEAKDLGIKMGASYFEIRDLCLSKSVSVFSSNFSLYANISDRIMGMLKKMAPSIQIYSVDEAFLNLEGMEDFKNLGEKIRSEILQHIGVPTGVGIARTKVLSKVANHLAKSSPRARGVVYLENERLENIALKRTHVKDVWGIGKASSLRLKALGIRTAYDFKNYANEKLIQKILSKTGVQIKHELAGISCFSINTDVEKKKEIMCSRTFGPKVYDKITLKEAVASYVSYAAEKMRSQNSVCMEIFIFGRTSSYGEREKYSFFERAKLSNPTCDTRKLIMKASSLLEKSFRGGFEYKKVGIKLGGFYDSEEYQIDFLSPSDSIKDIHLMKTIDLINYREGQRSLILGSCGTTGHAWKMNKNFKSPRYTTSWNELPVFNS